MVVSNKQSTRGQYRPALFNIFIDNLDNEKEYILSTFKGDTKLGRVTDMLNAKTSAQRDLEKLQN